MHNKLVVMIVW